MRICLLAVLVAICVPAQAGAPAPEAKALAVDPAHQGGAANDPKPVHPGGLWRRQVNAFLSNFDCSKSDFRDDLAALENLKGLEDVLREHVAEVPDFTAEAKYQELLKAWLIKRLLKEDGISEKQIASLLEAYPGMTTAEQVADIKRQAEVGSRLGEAEDARDGLAICVAIRDLFLDDWQRSTRRADRLAAANAALEAEALRLGIALD